MENEKNPLIDIIENISKNLNNTNTEYTQIENEKNNNNLNIFDLLNNFSGNLDTNNSKNNNTFDFSNILKMQKIISAFNKDDERKNLLTSIKPFLRTSRQNKIDEYITYLSIITAISAFNDKKE